MNQENNLPRLPTGWVWTILREIIESIKGKKPRSSTSPDNSLAVPYINIEAFENKVFKQYTDEKELPVCEPKDVLIVWDGARCGLVGTGVSGVVGSTLAKLKAYELDNSYLFYFLKTKFHYINQRPRGVGIPHVEPNLFWEIPFPLPPLPEQRRIVAKIEELFTRLDAGVKALKKIQLQLKRYRRSVLKSAFSGELTAEWREAHKSELEPISVLLAKIKEERKKSNKYNELPPLDTSDFPELPEGWVWTRVGEVSLTIQYGTSDKANENSTGIPVIRMGNLQDGKIIFDKLKYLPKDYPQLDDFLLKEGDVLFNRTNSAELVGKSAVYTISHPKALFASYLIRIKVNGEDYIPEILSYYINSDYGRAYIGSVVSQQVGQANVNGTKLSLMPIPLFPIAEQKRVFEDINLCFSVADKIENTMEQSLRQSERIRQSILKRAFEGKLVPQKPDDEPAEKLLERIKVEKDKTRRAAINVR